MHPRPVNPAEDSAVGRVGGSLRIGVDRASVPGMGADQLAHREFPRADELSSMLERARAALARGNAEQTLGILDEALDAAMRTESGCYCRAAALALLRLPEEAEKTLDQALVQRGGSIALLFLQSVVRSGVRDATGASDALASALARSPALPVLHAWRAVLAAREGDHAGAVRLLTTIQANAQSATLLSWARQAIRTAALDAARASASNSSSTTQLITPVRLGLSLLIVQPPPPEISTPRTAPVPHTTPESDNHSGPDEFALSDSYQSGKRLRALALGCMALAFASMVYGYGAAAIALAGGASWLALRSSTDAASARRAARRAAQEESGH